VISTKGADARRGGPSPVGLSAINMSVVIHCMRCDRQDHYAHIGQAKQDWRVVGEVVEGSSPNNVVWVGYCSPCFQIEQRLFQDEIAAGQSANDAQKGATQDRIRDDIDRLAGSKKKKHWRGRKKRRK